MGFDGFVTAQVKDRHIVDLAQAVQPADALFHPHGIPGKIVVDKLMTKLEVTPFSAALRAYHHPHPSVAFILPKRCDRCLFLADVQTAVKTYRCNVPLVQLAHNRS